MRCRSTAGVLIDPRDGLTPSMTQALIRQALGIERFEPPKLFVFFDFSAMAQASRMQAGAAGGTSGKHPMSRSRFSNQRLWAIVVLVVGIFLARQFRVASHSNSETAMSNGIPDSQFPATELHANFLDTVRGVGGRTVAPTPITEDDFHSRARLHAAATQETIILHSSQTPPSQPAYYPPTLQEGLSQAQLQPPIPREFPESLSSLMPIRRPEVERLNPSNQIAEQNSRHASTTETQRWPDEDYERKTPPSRNLLDPRSTQVQPPGLLENRINRPEIGQAVTYPTALTRTPIMLHDQAASTASDLPTPNAHIIRQPHRSPRSR